jgi:hypothetical protein
MAIIRRVFVRAPQDGFLSAGHTALKAGILDKIKNANFALEIFESLRSGGQMAADMPWSLSHLRQVESRCVGAVIIGLPRYTAAMNGREVQFASELCHLEGGVAYGLDLPLFVLADESLQDRAGIFKESDEFFVICVPRAADQSWLESSEFVVRFETWIKKLKDRRDVFLGYCNCASDLADSIQRFLAELDATTLDWKADFQVGNMIFSQIQKASFQCSSAIFLFTKDDPMTSGAGTMSPRDNVIFETGYFCHAKGQERVLIVREQDAKMPADLGGNIYVTIDNRNDITPIKHKIKAFLER